MAKTAWGKRLYSVFLIALIAFTPLLIFLMFALPQAEAYIWSDNFDDNSLDTANWTAGGVGTYTVTETNQRIELGVNALGARAWIVSANARDLSGNYLQADLVANGTGAVTEGKIHWILTKVTTTAPESKSSWYSVSLQSNGGSGYYKVRSKISGGSVNTLATYTTSN